MSEIKGRQRDPPPALFLHPSPGASHVSLSNLSAPPGGLPILRRDHSALEHGTSLRSGTALPSDPHRTGRAGSTRSTDKTDALWAEMQATLEEVELSASGGTHVFGPGHDQKLSELRSAQISLAQAWARSEADESLGLSFGDKESPSTGGEVRNLRGVFVEPPKSSGTDGTDHARGVNEASGEVSDNRNENTSPLSSQAAGEPEMDIVLGRKRREANDKYFQRVNDGVIDVVAKLEEVAVAMRAVEQESQDVWNEGVVFDTSQ
ncbi:hypothetical protein VFPPC_01094 [Pochonia chlamydosporia 170]|uniref:Uncharacterized protein n=1 Tax=Pochonia chlamydosporia 170 TaxID=1380566 RepID=A0A179G7I8_METCM|nr:hypothetical protein VFPPC_01094 [Pochonia chlamydosporia 170]OAQ73373.1 hypothetical protein VFPPC_01094 [Pochonia chlamydosporia 170]